MLFLTRILLQLTETGEKAEPEYEIIDTGIFDNNEYFDITIEYAKGRYS